MTEQEKCVYELHVLVADLINDTQHSSILAGLAAIFVRDAGGIPRTQANEKRDQQVSLSGDVSLHENYEIPT